MSIRKKIDHDFNWIPFCHPLLPTIWYWGFWVYDPYDKKIKQFIIRIWKKFLSIITDPE
jgi:hypothetical protein